MPEVKKVVLDQYGIEPFEQQQFGPAGVERVNMFSSSYKTGYKQLKLTDYAAQNRQARTLTRILVAAR